MGPESLSFPQLLQKMRHRLKANADGLNAAELAVMHASYDYVETVYQQFEIGGIRNLGGTPEAPLTPSECSELFQVAINYAKHARGGALPHFELDLSAASRLHVLAFHVVGPLFGSDKPVRVAFISPTAQASEAARRYWSDYPTHVKDCLFLTWKEASISLDGAFIIGDVNLDGVAPSVRELMSSRISQLKANDKVALILLGRKTGAPVESPAREATPAPANAKGCLSAFLVLLMAGVLVLCIAMVF